MGTTGHSHATAAAAAAAYTSQDDLLEQLSIELDDYWSSTTTSAGDVGGTYLVDTALKANTADWIVTGATAYLPASGQTRLIDNLTLDTSRLYVQTAFDAQVGSSIAYEIHRLFNRTRKIQALQQAVELLWPDCFEVIRDTSIVIVADTYEYSINSLGIYENHPYQVLYQQNTTVATEPYLPLTDWGVTPDGKLYLPDNNDLSVGRKLCIVGIKPLVWESGNVNIISPQTSILVAQAAVWLYRTAIQSAGAQDTTVIQSSMSTWQEELSRRRILFKMIPPAMTKHTGGQYPI